MQKNKGIETTYFSGFGLTIIAFSFSCLPTPIFVCYFHFFFVLDDLVEEIEEKVTEGGGNNAWESVTFLEG